MPENVTEVPPSGEPLPEIPDGEFPYPRRKGRKRTAAASAKAASPEPESAPKSAPVITQDELEKTVIGSMSFLAALLDESFTVLDAHGNPLPHVKTACAQMLPWTQIYGGVLVKAMPWFGLATGLAMLVSPAIDPTVEIIVGARKPRFMRTSPTDVYTEKYQRARDQVVTMAPPPTGTN